MRSQPYYARLGLLAFMLFVVGRYFPLQPWHIFFQCAGAGLLMWAIVLMYLRKTGRSNWNGPTWGKKLRASPRSRRILAVLPALCAVWVPILFLLNRQWGLTDAQLGMACGVPLGISLSVLVMVKSKARSCCLPAELPQTQQGGTK